MTEAFRPMFFTARIADGEVRIWKWQSLNDAIETIRQLVPELHPKLTAEHVRRLANADTLVRGKMPMDEFAALWLARVVYDPYVPNNYDHGEMFSADQATWYARQLITNRRPKRPFDALTEFSKVMKDLLLLR